MNRRVKRLDRSQKKNRRGQKTRLLWTCLLLPALALPYSGVSLRAEGGAESSELVTVIPTADGTNTLPVNPALPDPTEKPDPSETESKTPVHPTEPVTPEEPDPQPEPDPGPREPESPSPRPVPHRPGDHTTLSKSDGDELEELELYLPDGTLQKFRFEKELPVKLPFGYIEASVECEGKKGTALKLDSKLPLPKVLLYLKEEREGAQARLYAVDLESRRIVPYAEPLIYQDGHEAYLITSFYPGFESPLPYRLIQSKVGEEVIQLLCVAEDRSETQDAAATHYTAEEFAHDQEQRPTPASLAEQLKSWHPSDPKGLYVLAYPLSGKSRDEVPELEEELPSEPGESGAETQTKAPEAKRLRRVDKEADELRCSSPSFFRVRIRDGGFELQRETRVDFASSLLPEAVNRAEESDVESLTESDLRSSQTDPAEENGTRQKSEAHGDRARSEEPRDGKELDFAAFKQALLQMASEKEKEAFGVDVSERAAASGSASSNGTNAAAESKVDGSSKAGLGEALASISERDRRAEHSAGAAVSQPTSFPSEDELQDLSARDQEIGGSLSRRIDTYVNYLLLAVGLIVLFLLALLVLIRFRRRKTDALSFDEDEMPFKSKAKEGLRTPVFPAAEEFSFSGPERTAKKRIPPMNVDEAPLCEGVRRVRVAEPELPKETDDFDLDALVDAYYNGYGEDDELPKKR